MQEKKRIFYLDLIRAIGVIIIIIYHFNLLLSRNSIGESLNLPLKFANGDYGQMGVVLFLMLSGAALMYTYREEFSLKTYFVKRFLSLFPLFWLSYIFAFIYRFWINKGISFNVPVWKFILTIIGFDGYTNGVVQNFYILGTWFLGCIILLYLLFPLLRLLLNKYPNLSLCGIGIYYFLMISFYQSPMRAECDFLLRIPDFFLGMYLVKKWGGRKMQNYSFFNFSDCSNNNFISTIIY